MIAPDSPQDPLSDCVPALGEYHYHRPPPDPPLVRVLSALVAVLITISCVALFVRDADNAEYYATHIGEQRSLPLRDGSLITLNTDSGIKLRSDGPTLYVQILRGEVHFNMVPDAHRRLIVSVGDRVEVIDTATIFNVRLTHRGVRVTVKEGRVDLSVAHVTQVKLHENQQATIDAGPSSLAIREHNVSSSEIERQLSWLKGYLDFQCEPLANAASEFNRYNLTHIEITDGPTKNVQIGGTFSTTDPVTFAEAIAQVMPNVELDSALAPNGTRILRLRKQAHSLPIPPSGCTSQSYPDE